MRMSTQPLFTTFQMGGLHLPDRIVMAPLTRMRAGSINHVPTQPRGLSDYPTLRQAAA